MALTMIVTGFGDVTPSNLPTFTGVLEESTVSVFGVEDVFFTDGHISIILHVDALLKMFLFAVFLRSLPLEFLFSIPKKLFLSHKTNKRWSDVHNKQLDL
jgi:hypothetical protein